MVRNKDRIHVMLYARSGPGYHWAPTWSPKDEGLESTTETTRYHVVNDPYGHWQYEAISTRSSPTPRALVRLTLGKVKRSDVNKLEEILENIPIVQDDLTWTCRSWVEAAVEELGRAHILRTHNWEAVESDALWYVQSKLIIGRR